MSWWKYWKKDYAYLCSGYYNFGYNNEKVFNLAKQLDGKTAYDQITILEIISNCYAKGIGVWQNNEQAEIYYKKANQLRFETNAKALEEFTALMMSDKLRYDEIPF